jgi:hypothetical protein
LQPSLSTAEAERLRAWLAATIDRLAIKRDQLGVSDRTIRNILGGTQGVAQDTVVKLDATFTRHTEMEDGDLLAYVRSDGPEPEPRRWLRTRDDRLEQIETDLAALKRTFAEVLRRLDER